MSGVIKDNEGRSSGLVKSTTVTAYDDNKLQANVALLGFKTAVNGSLAKYSLVDQIIDEYTDATGVDASASTNERLTAGVYDGAVTSTPTRTQDADATGTDGLYTWFKWTDTGATGSYSANANETAEFLVVAGGGGGGGEPLSGAVGSGAGGAGGLRNSYGSVNTGGGASTESDLSLVSGTTYTMTVGAGGAAQSAEINAGNAGSASSITGSDITDITTVGGGGGGYGHAAGSVGAVGGSGGGGGAYGTAAGGAGTSGQGYAGGTASSGQECGGGGGGAASVGDPGVSGGTKADGGAGLTIGITGSDVGYAGGGGGGDQSGDNGTASHGGGAGGSNTASGTAGTANTGGGGGGTGGNTASNTSGGAGGSGIVVIRVLTSTVASGANLTLQSTDTTASTADPNYADMIILMENAEGAATLNTDIKGYISEDSGVTFTQGTLLDEGSWGTNKKIVAFHDLDISAQSGSAMCYKITTHNQSAGSKETKIHATSIGWR